MESAVAALADLRVPPGINDALEALPRQSASSFHREGSDSAAGAGDSAAAMSPTEESEDMGAVWVPARLVRDEGAALDRLRRALAAWTARGGDVETFMPHLSKAGMSAAAGVGGAETPGGSSGSRGAHRPVCALAGVLLAHAQRALDVITDDGDDARIEQFAALYTRDDDSEDRGVEVVEGVAVARASVAAMRLYLNLLAVPGAAAYGVFMPAVALSCLGVLRRLFTRCLRTSASGVVSTQRATQDADMEGSDEEDGGMMYPPTYLRDEVAGAMKDFQRFVSQFALSRHAGVRAQALDLLALVIRTTSVEDLITTTGCTKAVASKWCDKVTLAATEAIVSLSRASTHGKSDSVACLRHVLRELLPALIGENSTKARRCATRIVELVSEVAAEEDSATKFQAVHALLQHVCVGFKDRAENRAAACSVVVAALNPMPSKQVSQFASFLERMSKNKRASFRLFAAEAAAAMFDATLSAGLDVWGAGSDSDAASAAPTSPPAPAAAAEVVAVPTDADMGEGEEKSAPPAPPASPAVTGTPKAVTGTPAAQVASAAKTPATVVRSERVDPAWRHLLLVLATRCTDKNATVRAKALQGVTAVLSVHPARLSDLDEAFMVSEAGSSVVDWDATALDITATTSALMTTQDGGDVTQEKAPHLQGLLVRRLSDVKSVVRKCALSALATLGGVAVPGEASLDNTTLRLIVMRCTDEAVSVRKAAISALGEILALDPWLAANQAMWLTGVVPLVNDAETGVQNAALAAVDKYIFDPIIAWYAEADAADGSDDDDSQPYDAVWSLMARLSAHQELVRSIKRVVGLRARAKTLRSGLFAALRAAAVASVGPKPSALVMQRRSGAWVVLEALAQEDQLPVDSKMAFVPDCFRSVVKQVVPTQATEGIANQSSEVAADDACRMLHVLASTCDVIPAEEASALADEILGYLAAFVWPANLAAAGVDALARLCVSKAPSNEEASSMTAGWTSTLLAASEPAIRDFALADAETAASLSAPGVAARLFAVGHVAVLGLADADKDRERKSDDAIRVPQVPIPSSLVTLVQTLVAPRIALMSEGDAVVVPDEIRAHAFTALGKLCLRDESLAKKCITMFVRELESQESPVVVRNNVLFVLGDMCIRYTALVDRYVPAMAALVRDASPLLRRHATMLLIQLLIEDYVKWRGVLFFRFIAALADPDDDVRAFAEGSLASVLLQKAPLLLTANFVEALVVLQGCSEHPAYARVMGANDAAFEGGASGDRIPLSLAGEGANAKKRMHIYRTLLKHMNDEQRFTVAARLTKDILGAVVDGDLKLPRPSPHATAAATPSAAATAALAMATPSNDIHAKDSEDATGGTVSTLVAEAFAVLSCKEIRIAASKKPTSDENHDPDDAAAAAESAAALAAAGGASQNTAAVAATTAAVAVAKRKMMTKLARKNTLENVLPTVVAMKHIMQKARSPLLGALMRYMKVLFTDYRADMAELLAADRQLAAEIEYDMRVFDEQQKAVKAATRAAQALTAVPATPYDLHSKRKFSAIASPPPAAPSPAGARARVKTPTLTPAKLKRPSPAVLQVSSPN